MSSKDEKKVKNHLDDIEFCIRKGIGVYCINKYLKSEDKGQEDLANYLGITQPTVSRWKKTDDVKEFTITSTSDSRHAPTLMQIILISSFLHKSLSTMLRDVINEEQKKPLLLNTEMVKRVNAIVTGMSEITKDSSEHKGTDHFGIINKLQKSRYIGFFISSDPRKNVEHLIIDTAEAVRSASVPAFTRIIGKAENIYRCNIVSPPNQKHLYIYLRQDSGKYDRGMIVFKVDNDIQGPFDCGSGIMLTTNRKSEEKRLQWIVIIRIGENYDQLTSECSDERSAPYIQNELATRAMILNEADTLFEQEESVKTADQIVESILKEPLPAPNEFYMDFECLKDRQDYLYEEVYETFLKHIPFAFDYDKYH